MRVGVEWVSVERVCCYPHLVGQTTRVNDSHPYGNIIQQCTTIVATCTVVAVIREHDGLLRADNLFGDVTKALGFLDFDQLAFQISIEMLLQGKRIEYRSRGKESNGGA